MSGFFEGRLIAAVGDITRLTVDAIVNAANSSLMGGGGVDGAIHRAGGPAILQACRVARAERFPDGLPAGRAVETTAGELPARYVIHTVGPVWHGGNYGEEETLRSCYVSSLEIAERLGLHSIAFPAISTGIYGFPRERAAAVVWKVLGDWLSSHELPRTVTLEFYSKDDQRIFLAAADRET
jgi:O-acetyl-ADP-ribose deacetylase (regulator of RNase III)